jgi:hypothetical protein
MQLPILIPIQPYLAPLLKTRASAAIGALCTGTIMGISLCKSQVFRPGITLLSPLISKREGKQEGKIETENYRGRTNLVPLQESNF